MAGVGKTAFAVHAAHRLAGRFPGGQIFVPLHGYTPGQRPADPAAALASLLLAIGVPAGQIPPGLEARMALWRDRLAEQQLLIVLDDAVSSEQVSPLLPGAGGSLVLITSRRRLTALEDATTISLDALPPDDAAGLLVRLAARPGLSRNDPPVRDMIRLCGYLPLAIGMVARQLHHHPAWTVAWRVGELTAARDRLVQISTEDVSVAAAFDLSYAQLSEGQRVLFRRLGEHPGGEFDAYAAAALHGTDLAAGRSGLEKLYDRYLLTEISHGRYRMHDLIREHARDLADRLDPDQDREQAVSRLLDYYQRAAVAANTFDPRFARVTAALWLAPSPVEVPTLADREQALSWVQAERASLLACLDHVTTTGQHARVVVLTAALAALLVNSPRAEAVSRHTAALQAARRLGDRSAQADALLHRGKASQQVADPQEVIVDYEEALRLHRDIGDLHGQADALSDLADVWRMTGDFPAAIRAVEEAQPLYRAVGDRYGQANAVRQLGTIRLQQGEFPAAIQSLTEALAINPADRLTNATTLTFLGYTLRQTGDYLGATEAMTEALSAFRAHNVTREIANTLVLLGELRMVTGEYPAAAAPLREALGLYRDLGDRLGGANVTLMRGGLSMLAGDYPAAARTLDEAIASYRDLGEPGGEAEALNQVGVLRLTMGDLQRASSSHRQALDLASGIGAAQEEARARAGLGRCALAEGRAAAAADWLRQALEIFQRIGAAEAQDLRAEVDALASPPPGP
jgi:tetratricopeptide (TPR) repeat protein